MNEAEVINVFKQYNDKNTEIVRKAPAFLLSAAISSHLAHYLAGLNYVKQNTKDLEMNKHIIITFPWQRQLAFLKDLFFVFVSFAFVATCISVSLLGNR